MFGQNPIRSIETDPLALAVEEVFYTIQGEGPQAGRPAVFIRMAGCNLACHFCDTQFETRAEQFEGWNSIAARIIKDFTREQRRLVVLTGGEPMRQNIENLAFVLLRNGTKLIQIETAGTLWQDGYLPLVHSGQCQIVCSPKTPKVHPMIATHCRHWKYVIRGGEVDLTDGLPNRGTQIANRDKEQRLYRPERVTDTIWLSPCDDYDPELNAVNMALARDLCLKHGYRLSLQVHKIIGVA